LQYEPECGAAAECAELNLKIAAIDDFFTKADAAGD